MRLIVTALVFQLFKNCHSIRIIAIIENSRLKQALVYPLTDGLLHTLHASIAQSLEIMTMHMRVQTTMIQLLIYLGFSITSTI